MKDDIYEKLEKIAKTQDDIFELMKKDRRLFNYKTKIIEYENKQDYYGMFYYRILEFLDLDGYGITTLTMLFDTMRNDYDIIPKVK